MSKLNPGRKLALDVITELRSRKAFVHNIIQTAVRPAKGISVPDKAFAELLSIGVVSTSGTLDEIINRSLGPKNDLSPALRDSLRISVYELAFLNKQPHAVVDQGVELARSIVPKAAGFANVMLRRMTADLKKFPWGDPKKDDEALARKYGFPYWLTDLLIEALGRNEAVLFMDASNTPAPIFLAANSIKSTPEEVLSILNEHGAEASFVGPADRGCIIAKDAQAAVKSQLLADGRAIVSDATAQLVALAATPVAGKPFLEIGSGRGTKTVLLQSNAYKFNGEQAEMYCVDLHAFKTKVLQRRIKQCGVQNTTILEGDATALETIEGLPKSFAKALIDVPCSGLGTLRRHPEIRWRITASEIDDMARVGLGMLKSVSRRMEPKGTIIYSTCTVSREENQDVIEAFLASPQGAQWRIDDSVKMLQNSLRPNGADVHFLACLKKSS